MTRHREHTYELVVDWNGNRGTGTSDYRSYGREHTISAGEKPPIPGSSDAAFRGDAARWNPEELLLASLSTCHQLWYLHLCADAGIRVLAYRDASTGTMSETAGSRGGRSDARTAASPGACRHSGTAQMFRS